MAAGMILATALQSLFTKELYQWMFDQFRGFRNLMREELELHNLMRATGFDKEQCFGLKERFSLSYQDLADYYLAFHRFPKKKHVIIIRHFGAKVFVENQLQPEVATANFQHQPSICRQIKDT